MFLFERLISLGTFSILILGTVILISMLRGKQYKAVLVLLWLALTVMGYLFIPDVTMDLYRLHMSCINGFCITPWNDAVYTMRNTSTPMWILWAWSIYNFFSDVNFVQMFSWLWGGANIFYIISHTIDNQNIKHFNRGLLFFSVMAIGSFYSGFIIGIRNMLSFSIIIWCFYREVVEHKSVMFHLPFYLFAALMHQAGLALVLIRFVFFVFMYKNILLRIFVSIAVAGCLTYLIVNGNYFVESAVEKAYNYSQDSEEYVYYWSMLIAFINQIQIGVILYNYKRKIGLAYSNYKQIFYLSLLLLFVSIAALPFSFAIFTRFTLASSLLTVPLLGRMLSSDINLSNRKMKFILWGLCIVIFVLSVTRGNMCGYKFFLL